MAPINALLASSLVIWLVGIFLIKNHCRKMGRLPVPNKLPFGDPDHAPPAFRLIATLYILSLIGLILVGPLAMTLALMKIQSLVLWRSDSVAVFNAGNFFLFWFPCFPLALGLYGALRRVIILRFPDHEIFQAYTGSQHRYLWLNGTMGFQVRRQRVSDARILAWSWLLAGPLILLGLGNYAHLNKSGLNTSGYWDLRETHFAWSDLRNARLFGGTRSARKSRVFTPHFAIYTLSGQTFELMASDGPIPLIPLESTLAAARILRQHGVPVTVSPLTPDQRKAMETQTADWQQRIAGLWRDVSELKP
ncbi:hypothetical protein EON80_14895 [bacterium]|nr:MAG: hypothetical protein EON80_14895 [bacterium]